MCSVPFLQNACVQDNFRSEMRAKPQAQAIYPAKTWRCSQPAMLSIFQCREAVLVLHKQLFRVVKRVVYELQQLINHEENEKHITVSGIRMSTKPLDQSLPDEVMNTRNVGCTTNQHQYCNVCHTVPSSQYTVPRKSQNYCKSKVLPMAQYVLEYTASS